jgi:signal transduction histidine kinase
MGFTSWLFLMIGVGVGLLTRPQVERLLGRSPTTSSTQVEDRPDSQPPDLMALDPVLQDTLSAYYQVVEMSQFRSGFLARTSHELRSPLSSIISLHQLILSDLCEDQEEERECVSQAYAATQKMLALLDSVILVSKTEVGTARLQIQPVQLATVIEEVYTLTHLLAQNRNLRLSMESVDSDLWVLADPRRLQQILLMLVDMSITLMNNGYIRVSIHPRPETHSVEVWIDDYRPASAWQEPLDFMGKTTSHEALMQQLLLHIRTQAALPSPIARQGSPRLPVSTGMALMMCQHLLELMNGRLEILETPTPPSPETDPDAVGRSRLSCCLPLATDQDALLE